MMSLDTVGGFNYHNSQKKYLHIVLDRATKYTWTFPSKSVTSETYTNCLKQIFSIQCPKQLLSNRNAAFTWSKFKKFLKHHNIRQLLTSANRPQCNGKNERVNQTLIAKLRCKVNSTTKIPWTKLLEQVTCEYNNSPNDVTGFPPAYLMFGTLPYDSPLPNQVKLNYPPIQQARQIAVNRTIKHHKINKQRYDKHYVDAKFKVGVAFFGLLDYKNSPQSHIGQVFDEGHCESRVLHSARWHDGDWMVDGIQEARLRCFVWTTALVPPLNRLIYPQILTRGVYWLQCIKLPCRKSNLGNHTAQAKAVLVVIAYQPGIGIRE
ncbi:retrotransposable element Tf2 protein type 1 [Trichonephila clavipes]|nr:retrotransposable element Tf2 protein type 1 [Trichonephila clavipes]